MVNGVIPRIVISGLRGGSGKTILSLSLIAQWSKKGINVTPFKKGPDYIDAGWLAQAAGKECFNLDLFMMSPEQVVHSFIYHAYDSEIAVIEGNRGLYDGVDPEGTYSTAQLAKLLKAPVILILDCAKVTSTLGAMVLGLQKLDPEVAIKGVVLNDVANKRQGNLIRRAIHKTCKLPVLGVIPRLQKGLLPERHMGLIPFQEHINVKKLISFTAEIGAKYLHIEEIWRIASEVPPLNLTGGRSKGQGIRGEDSSVRTSFLSPPSLKIGVIKDSAFQFYYPENFEELQKQGAELIEISALKTKELPDLDALYIGGGFPETHALTLAENEAFRESLYKAIERGLPVYAECGGLMYLGESLIVNNKKYPMVGVFPLIFILEEKPQAHGYTVIEVEKTNPYFSKGHLFKGHEFHYSRLIEFKEDKGFMIFKVRRGRGIKNGMDGICYKNTLATYTHLHALGAPEWVEGMIKCAKKFKKFKNQNSKLWKK